jgi:uncharacterized protein
MRRAVLWDSSAILALLDRDDRNHRTAIKVADRIVGEKRQSFITNYIEAETHALLLRRLGRALAREWILTATLPVVRARQRDEEDAKGLIARFKDKDWSFCDAVSFCVMQARGVGSAFAFDPHFAQFGRYVVLGLAD